MELNNYNEMMSILWCKGYYINTFEDLETKFATSSTYMFCPVPNHWYKETQETCAMELYIIAH